VTSGDDGPPPARPQDLLVTILGDYLLPGDAGGLPAGALSRSWAIWGRPRPPRMALSRLSASHLIARRRQGRATNYRLTEHGRRVLGEGRDRTFSFGQQTSWSGTWTLLMHTIPEQKRALRHDLRKRLRFLGFTTLHAATGSRPRPHL
jgi:phenylacetic acid degradation operon negative regulatory protein